MGVPLAEDLPPCSALVMEKRKDIVFALDGDDSFAHFENPEWVKKMQAKAKKFAALASSPEMTEPTGRDKPVSSSDLKGS